MTGPARIAFVGLNYAPEQVGIGPFTAGMAEGLAARGHAVEAIVGQPYYPQWRAHPGHRGWARSEEQGVRVTRCPHYIPASPSGWRRIVHLASFAGSALIPALRAALTAKARRPQVFICIAPALLSVPVAWLAARIAGAKLWVHVQDFEVEAAFATGLIAPGPFARLAAGTERRVLALADRISTISPQMCARLVAKGIPAARVIEVRNWANAPAPDLAEGAAYRAEWSLQNRRIALYSGNIANKQGIEIVVEAARLLAARADIVFVVCGEGPNRAALEQRAAGLTNIRFHDLQPAARMGELLSLASVHLLPQIAGAADLVLPSKLANMLASARPVVATADPGTGLYAEVQGCGLATPPGNAQALADAIAALVDDPERAALFGRNGAERAAQRWSQAAIISQMSAEIARLLADG
ncbi:MAG: WcaI family glycosyltransferase [Novosphingobium sp.]